MYLSSIEENKLLYSCLRVVNTLLVHYYTSIPLLLRAYVLSISIRQSYYHLTEKVYDEKFQKKSHEIFMRQYNSIDTNQCYYIKRIILILAIFTIIVFSLFFFESSRCFLVFYASYGYETIQACGDLN